MRSMSRNEHGYLATEVSRQISKKLKKDIRYSLLTVDETYKLFKARTKTGNAFREALAEHVWNRERFRIPKLLFPDSEEYLDELHGILYKGTPKYVTRKDRIVETLEYAGLVTPSFSKYVVDGVIKIRPEAGEAGIYSTMGSAGDLKIQTGRPDSELSCLLVLMRTNDRVKPETTRVEKWRLKELKGKSKMLDSLSEHLEKHYLLDVKREYPPERK